MDEMQATLVIILILLIALVVSLVLLVKFRKKWKNARFHLSNQIRITKQARAADNTLVVAVLAREIANELMERDEKNYRRNFEKLYYKWQEISKLDRQVKLSHIEKITAKYPSFLAFDLIGTKAHVLYADAFSWKSDDELWEFYENLRLYDALSCDLDTEWRFSGTGISEKEYEHLNEYCEKVSDTQLLAHLYRAREQLAFLRVNDVEENELGEWKYETNDYKFKRVADVVETRWGVYVKSLERYGMWGLFVDEVAYTSFYSADKDFNESFIGVLGIRVCLDKRNYKTIEKQEY